MFCFQGLIKQANIVLIRLIPMCSAISVFRVCKTWNVWHLAAGSSHLYFYVWFPPPLWGQLAVAALHILFPRGWYCPALRWRHAGVPRRGDRNIFPPMNSISVRATFQLCVPRKSPKGDVWQEPSRWDTGSAWRGCSQTSALHRLSLRLSPLQKSCFVRSCPWSHSFSQPTGQRWNIVW